MSASHEITVADVVRVLADNGDPTAAQWFADEATGIALAREVWERTRNATLLASIVDVAGAHGRISRATLVRYGFELTRAMAPRFESRPHFDALYGAARSPFAIVERWLQGEATLAEVDAAGDACDEIEERLIGELGDESGFAEAIAFTVATVLSDDPIGDALMVWRMAAMYCDADELLTAIRAAVPWSVVESALARMIVASVAGAHLGGDC